MISVYPLMTFSGVLNSWEMTPRNSSFPLLADFELNGFLVHLGKEPRAFPTATPR